QPLLRGVLHIGIVVDDLELSLREWQRVFGVSVGDRWQSDVGVKVAFLDVAGTRLELVEYTGPIVQRFGPVLARRDGVHHVCFAGLAELAAGEGRALDAFLADVEVIVHGTTVTTNAVLTGEVARVGLLTTRGFRDALAMRRGIREAQYDNRYTAPPPLVERWL